MFHGDYNIQLLREGSLVDEFDFTVQPAACDLFGAQNLLINGEFENFDAWKTNDDPWPFNFSKKKYGNSYRSPQIRPGMVGNGLYLFETQLSHAVWQELSTPLIAGKKYNLHFNAKIFGSGSLRVFFANAEGDKIAVAAGPPAGHDKDSLWSRIDWSFEATGDEFYILFYVHNGGDGDVIFDHAYLVSKADFLTCRESLTFSPGKIKICLSRSVCLETF